MYRSLFAAPLALFCVSCGSVVQRADIRSPQLPLRSDAEPSGRALEIDEDSAQEAIDFYLLKRTGGAPLPAEKLIEAQRHARTMPLYSIANRRFVTESAKSPVRDAALGTWQPLGPGNVGGRTRSLVIRPDDPNTMYAGSVGGGVWKTTDGGASWNPLTDLLPSIGIASLAMDPKNPDTLYAGTGEYFTSSDRGDSIRGAGIFKTTDGGNTWKQLSFTATSSFYYVHKLVISPHDSRRVYAATYGGVWLSSDAGDTWRRVLDRTGDLYGCQDLVIRTDRTTDYLFAACASSNATNPAIYRNVDAAGQGQWQIVFNPANLSRTALALAPSNKSIV